MKEQFSNNRGQPDLLSERPATSAHSSSYAQSNRLIDLDEDSNDQKAAPRTRTFYRSFGFEGKFVDQPHFPLQKALTQQPEKTLEEDDKEQELKSSRKDSSTPHPLLHEEYKASLIPFGKDQIKVFPVNDEEPVPLVKVEEEPRYQPRFTSETLFKYQLMLETLGSVPDEDKCDIIYTPIPNQKKPLKCTIRNTSRGFGGFIRPTYELFLTDTERSVLFAKREKNSIKSNYDFSLSSEHFDPKRPSFMGTLKADLVGTKYDLVYKTPITSFSENFASIHYDFQLFSKKGPRKFTVVGPKEGRIRTSDLFKEYQKNGNANCIVLKPKVPTWDERLQAHVLDFKGKAKMPSEHNFILTMEGTGNDVMLIGKVKDDVYNLEVYWPLSVIQAFAIALSSFAFKVGF